VELAALRRAQRLMRRMLELQVVRRLVDGDPSVTNPHFDERRQGQADYAARETTVPKMTCSDAGESTPKYRQSTQNHTVRCW
jgi:hypothetical protein